MKKLLITGASGFIGIATIKAALEKDYDLYAVYHQHPPTKKGDIHWQRANLLDSGDVKNLFSEIKPDCLIQLAWCTDQGTYWKDHSNLDWLSANLDIARQFQINGGRRCVFAGTSAEYDWSGGQTLQESSTSLNPLLLYGGSKLALYWALMRFFEQESICFSWARFFNPFGEGEDERRLIPKTCLRLLKGDTLQFDAALSLRDFLHVEDVGEALIEVLDSNVAGAVNIASGQPMSVRDVISEIAKYYDCSSKVHFDKKPSTIHLQDSVTADTTKLNNECGWKPKKTFGQRIGQTCEWWKTYNQSK